MIVGFSIDVALYAYFIVNIDLGENFKIFLSYACHSYFEHYYN